MDFDYTSTIGIQLDLGLALHDQYLHKDFDGHRKKESKKEKMENSSKCNMAYPSLTLGPLDEDKNVNNQDEASKIESYDQNLHTQVTSPSMECSFSNSTSIKREIGEEFDVEIEKVPTNMGDHVDENGNPRKKLRLTKEQSKVLKENFREHSTLNPRQKQTLAKELNLSDRQVEVWFQNQRARRKVKQTESECELLKKCCESLREEKKKLQKEVEELEAMQTVAAPFYMQIIPAATLTICPSCEILCGHNNTNNASSPTTTTLLIGSNSHNPFYIQNNNNNDNNNNNNNKIYPLPHPSS